MSARPAIRRRAASLAALCLALLGPVQAACGATIEVVFDGVPNDRGQALFALFAAPEGFPNEVDAAVARARAEVVDGRARVVFENVAAGDYALSALHDANGSGGIDLNLFGIPKEKFGVSNVAKGRPVWRDARFTVSAGSGTIALELRPLRFY